MNEQKISKIEYESGLRAGDLITIEQHEETDKSVTYIVRRIRHPSEMPYGIYFRDGHIESHGQLWFPYDLA